MLKPFLHRILLSATLCLSGFAFTLTAAQAGDLRIELTAPGSQIPGRNLLINIGYALKFDVPVPEPFSIRVPEIDGLLSAPQTAEDPSVGLFKVSFAGRDRDAPDDIFLVENIEFFNISAPLGDLDARIMTLGKSLNDQFFPALTRGFDDANIISGRAIKIGPYDAVEIIGTYMDPQNGESALRLVGILHPESADSVLAISNIVTKYYVLTNPGDLAMTASGTLLQSFEYLN